MAEAGAPVLLLNPLGSASPVPRTRASACAWLSPRSRFAIVIPALRPLFALLEFSSTGFNPLKPTRVGKAHHPGAPRYQHPILRCLIQFVSNVSGIRDIRAAR